MENNNKYIDLITKYFSGEASAEEMQMLSNWIKLDSENQKLFEEFQNTWMNIEASKIENIIDVDEEWLKFKSSIKEKAEIPVISLHPEKSISRTYFYRALRIAAVFLVFAVSAYFSYYFLKNDQSKTTHITAQAETLEGRLPDGTTVTLNAGSDLSYPEKFENDKRNVTLHGEAYFNVTHEAERPFIIAANDLRVEVLGTSFYVNANADNGNVEVILTSGKVAVYHKDRPSELTILTPGEKAEFSKTDQKISKTENTEENYMAFKTKKLVFSDTRLDEIVLTLNKVYHSKIKIKDSSIANCTVSTTFDNQSLDAVLNVLKATLDLKVNKSGSGIELSGNGCK
jgi:ferric-dicitrate binding protein FerR (iron transport regulator)